MSCTKCEIIRSRIKARLWSETGKEFSEIAKKLSDSTGEAYYVKVETKPYKISIERANKISPHIPYKIISRPLKEYS